MTIAADLRTVADRANRSLREQGKLVALKDSPSQTTPLALEARLPDGWCDLCDAPGAVRADAGVDPVLLEPLITPRTRALYLIHYFGFPQPHTADLRALCDRQDCSAQKALCCLQRTRQIV